MSDRCTLSTQPGLCRLPDEKAALKGTLAIHFSDYLVQKGHGDKGRAAKDFCDDYNRGTYGSFPDIFKQLGPVSAKTLYRWYKYPLKREDKRGRWREGKIKAPALIEILEPLVYIPNNLPPAQIISAAKREAERRHITIDVVDETIRHYIEKITRKNKPVVTFLRQGRKALFDKHVRHLTQSTKDLPVGVLTCDGKRLNMDLLDFSGKRRRMALVTYFDIPSRYPAGWSIAPDEDVPTYLDGLFRGIIRLGKLPFLVHFDNSRAARSRTLNGSIDLEQSHLPGVMEQIGVPFSFAKPYNPTGKAHIERWHLTIDEFERLSPSFRGSNISDKPARLHRHEIFHQKLHEGSKIPTVMDFYWAFAWYVDNVYGCRPHRGLNGGMPLDVFQQGVGPGFTERETFDLRIKLLPQMDRTIHREGVRMPWSKKFLYDWPLYGHDGDKAVVKYDVCQPDRCWVFFKGVLLCEARESVSTSAAAQLGTEEQKKELNRQLKEQAAQIKQTISSARELVEKFVRPQVERQLEYSGFSKESISGQPLKQIEAKSPDQGHIYIGADPSPEDMALLEEGVKELQSLNEEEPLSAWEEVLKHPDTQRYIKLMDELDGGKELSPDNRTFTFVFEQSSPFQVHKESFEARRLKAALVCSA
ncbi:MAG: Mu transposase C-terminal domain-containing protein [Syntrophobacteraceae bacterium]